MDKIAILNEVNRLVTAGLRKSAIDIIQEYLEEIPNERKRPALPILSN